MLVITYPSVRYIASYVAADITSGIAIVCVGVGDGANVSAALCITDSVAGVGISVRSGSASTANVTVGIAVIGVGVFDNSFITADVTNGITIVSVGVLYLSCKSAEITFGVAIIVVQMLGLSGLSATGNDTLLAARIAPIMTGNTSGKSANVTSIVTSAGPDVCGSNGSYVATAIGVTGGVAAIVIYVLSLSDVSTIVTVLITSVIPNVRCFSFEIALGVVTYVIARVIVDVGDLSYEVTALNVTTLITVVGIYVRRNRSFSFADVTYSIASMVVYVVINLSHVAAQNVVTRGIASIGVDVRNLSYVETVVNIALVIACVLVLVRRNSGESADVTLGVALVGIGVGDRSQVAALVTLGVAGVVVYVRRNSRGHIVLNASDDITVSIAIVGINVLGHSGVAAILGVTNGIARVIPNVRYGSHILAVNVVTNGVARIVPNVGNGSYVAAFLITVKVALVIEYVRCYSLVSTSGIVAVSVALIAVHVLCICKRTGISTSGIVTLKIVRVGVLMRFALSFGSADVADAVTDAVKGVIYRSYFCANVTSGIAVIVILVSGGCPRCIAHVASAVTGVVVIMLDLSLTSAAGLVTGGVAIICVMVVNVLPLSDKGHILVCLHL